MKNKSLSNKVIGSRKSWAGYNKETTMQSFLDYLNESKEGLDEKRAPKMKSLGTEIKSGKYKVS